MPNMGSSSGLDLNRVRADFPILNETIRGVRLVYLDNAATAQKPSQVIEAVANFYETEYSNVHRGVYRLSQLATEAYEDARNKVAKFINAHDSRELVFVRGATEAINLVAQSFVKPRAKAGNEIVITEMDHHSNIVPWQLVCEETGMALRVAPITDEGEVVLSEFERMLSPKTILAAFPHVSNVLGTVNPAKEMVEMCRAKGVPTLVDGAQAVPHIPVDVQTLSCDFYVFSGHKLYGPSGIGALYGRLELLDGMRPYQGGGSMISSVTFEKTTFAPVPHKFEAGTPNIAGAIGFGVAVDYVSAIGIDNIAEHERTLLVYATELLSEFNTVRIVGQAKNKASALSFVMDEIHPHDIGTILDEYGVCIRAGHHCAQPLMHRLGLNSTARASFAAYNSKEDVDTLVKGLTKVIEVFS